MRCLNPKYIAVHPECAIRSYFDFSSFETQSTKTDYLLATSMSGTKFWEECDDNNIVYLNWEEPNDFWMPIMEETLKQNYHRVKKIYSCCPHSTEYLNKLYGSDKREYAFWPYNEKHIPIDFTKKYDVYFTGHIFGGFIKEFTDVVRKFNNCIVSFNAGTVQDVDFSKKIQLNAQSKISVVHNCLFNTFNLPLDNMFSGHKAFKDIKTSPFISQFKSRTNEAAACKSILLCHYEDLKCVEKQYTPNKDFIYWYNIKDLEEKIHEILKNYDKYTYLAENAYNKLINNWTTTAFFETYLKNL